MFSGCKISQSVYRAGGTHVFQEAERVIKRVHLQTPSLKIEPTPALQLSEAFAPTLSTSQANRLEQHLQFLIRFDGT